MATTNTVTKLSDRALSANVDRLGELNAQIAALAEQAKGIREKLVASGETSISGKRYRAVISEREVTKLDSKIVRSFLTAAQIKKASKTSTQTNVTLYDL